jgi:tetratricopeptide (TPR) repeat protein
MFASSRSGALGALLLICLAGSASDAAAQHGHDRSDHGGEPTEWRVPLYPDLGTHHHPITTVSRLAQAYFDQGLRLQYAFNHPEAIRSYRAALEVDASCAMCWWGIALATGHNINQPLSEEAGVEAYKAAQVAQAMSGGVTALEQDLIDALGERYAKDPSKNRAALDSAYARAMERVLERHPDNADVRTLYGAALMNLSPWNYWKGPFGDRKPLPGTMRILEVLEGTVADAPNHPGACHYFIHLVEAAFPERAVGCAERLASLMPGAGHLVHMPGHIYIRVGRYADAVRQNEHAVHSDERMIPDIGMPTVYTGGYYPHNYHFMAFAATMAGMSEKALDASRRVAGKVPIDVARETYWIQNAVVLPQLTLLTFGRWLEVLAEPAPAPVLEQASVMHRYARGVALAALGDAASANAVLDSLRAEAVPFEETLELNPVPHIAWRVLAGEIALRSGDPAGAVAHLTDAVRLEDQLLYDEPPLWYRPVRHALGRALLDAGRPSEAERVYREDLDKFRENGWSLLGLALSLEAQGRVDEASVVRERFEAAWGDADFELRRSSF